jgi:uncharacterized membrane protein
VSFFIYLLTVAFVISVATSFFCAWRAARKQRNPIGWVLIAYLSVAMTFGSLYYLIHLYHATSIAETLKSLVEHNLEFLN